MASSLPDWMIPPRPEGWFADDLDRLSEAPRHTELLDGALIFTMSPQQSGHGRLVRRLTDALEGQAPQGLLVEHEMTVRLDDRSRPEPDVVVARAEYDARRTWHAAADVVLVVEVISPESAHRDRTIKFRKYAAAHIAHYWLIEQQDDGPVVHLYELDGPTERYGPAGIARDKLQTTRPFAIDIDLTSLV